MAARTGWLHVRAHSMIAYTAVAIVTVLATLAMLLVIKIPAVIMLVVATLVSGSIVIFGRLELGYWDPFAPIAFVSLWFFSAIVSLGFIGVGRWLKWPFFLAKEAAQPMESRSAL